MNAIEQIQIAFTWVPNDRRPHEAVARLEALHRAAKDEVAKRPMTSSRAFAAAVRAVDETKERT